MRLRHSERGATLAGVIYGLFILLCFAGLVWFVVYTIEQGRGDPPLAIDWDQVETTDQRVQRTEAAAGEVLTLVVQAHEVLVDHAAERVLENAARGQISEDMGWPTNLDQVAVDETGTSQLDEDWVQQSEIRPTEEGYLELLTPVTDRFVANVLVQQLNERGMQAEYRRFSGVSGVQVRLEPSLDILRLVILHKVRQLNQWLETLQPLEELQREMAEIKHERELLRIRCEARPEPSLAEDPDEDEFAPEFDRDELSPDYLDEDELPPDFATEEELRRRYQRDELLPDDLASERESRRIRQRDERSPGENPAADPTATADGFDYSLCTDEDFDAPLEAPPIEGRHLIEDELKWLSTWTSQIRQLPESREILRTLKQSRTRLDWKP